MSRRQGVTLVELSAVIAALTTLLVLTVPGSDSHDSISASPRQSRSRPSAERMCCSGACCSNVPSTLYLRTVGGSPVTLTYNSSSGLWEGVLDYPWTFCDCSDNQEDSHIWFGCNPSDGKWQLEPTIPFITSDPVLPDSCSPFEWTFTFEQCGGCTATITDT